MLHVYAARFDVTGNLENFLVFWVNKKIGEMDTVALSFIFNKYYPIMD